ncbi:hypothetical protein BUE67_05395 [Corynebacterium diphtheriae]|nr:hypothetical protein BUE67_05395 [Corynebacterium diphtheriae]OLO14763.1 hypothetical protein BUV99_04325 [Corynebacterium diphtheriae]OLO22934.1 hypothetical protein BVH76_04340 [Corynebacterium diphtheriae]OLO23695.1 hypothetical protein BVH78_06170 [Corynebacterium diphtheriae]OMO43983.1 hypothetical protein BVL41_06900 [Corynebacterium diphtheriae]
MVALPVVACIDCVSDVGEGCPCGACSWLCWLLARGAFIDGLDGLGFNNGNHHRVLRCGRWYRRWQFR